MNSIIKLKGVDIVPQHGVLRELNKLCKEGSLPVHCYAVYYLQREPNRTEIILLLSGEGISSYALIWYGGRFSIMNIYEVHLWRPLQKIISEISLSPSKRADIQFYDSKPSDISIVKEHFKKLGFNELEVVNFYDMINNRDSFKPSPLENLAVKLREEHASLYRDLERERDKEIEMNIDEAREILKEYTHYGVIIDNTLASVAARYVITSGLHILGGVFTRKQYRGKGYAKAATSALTREVVYSGARACLHVETDYVAAIKMYRDLGYRIARERPWLFAHP